MRCSGQHARGAARGWVCAFALATLSSAVAHAEERAGAHVDVTIVGGGDPALEASIAELLASSGLGTHFERAERAGRRAPRGATPVDVIAVVQLDLGREGVLELHIVDPRRRRVLVWNLAIPHGIDEIVREEASHIVVYSVEAIQRGEDVGEPQPPANEPRPVRDRPAAPPSEPAMSLELETLGTVRSYASVAPAVLGTGAALALSTARSGVRLGGALSFEQRSAIVVTTQPLTARFGQRSLRIAAFGDFQVARGVVFRASAGAALDLVDVTTTPLRPTSEPRRASFVDVVPVLDVAAGLRFELAPRLTAGATGGIELPLSTSDYVVEDARGPDFSLLSPYALRLVGRVSVGVRF